MSQISVMRVVEKTLLADDIVGLRLRPEADFVWKAGQYLEIVLEEGKRRPFSIANAPHSDNGVELHIRHVPGGDFSARVFNELQVGDGLDVRGPLGRLHPHEDGDRPLLFVAGGTGFAPVKALIEHYLHRDDARRMRLYWGARDRHALYMDRSIRAWASRNPTFDYVPVVEIGAAVETQGDPADGIRQGIVHETVLADHPDLSRHDVFLGGPPGMVAACREAFLAAGLPEARLFYDR